MRSTTENNMLWNLAFRHARDQGRDLQDACAFAKAYEAHALTHPQERVKINTFFRDHDKGVVDNK